MSDEANTANNFMPVSFEVVRDRTRVLLADGVARWEYRYLNQLFRREEHVEFDELLFFPRVHGSGHLADRPEFPEDVEGWARYDVVILGDVSPQQLSPASQQSLGEYVRRRGGNLIVIAGGNSMPAEFAGQPLMELLPVERDPNVYPRQGYTLSVSDEGRFHSAMLIANSAEESIRQWRTAFTSGFPCLGLSEYSQPKSTARTLLIGGARRGWRNFGRGRRRTTPVMHFCAGSGSGRDGSPISRRQRPIGCVGGAAMNRIIASGANSCAGSRRPTPARAPTWCDCKPIARTISPTTRSKSRPGSKTRAAARSPANRSKPRPAPSATMR